MKKLLLLTACVLLSACGENRLSGKNADEFFASLNKMNQTLPKQQQEKLSDALLTIAAAESFSEADDLIAKAVEGRKIDIAKSDKKYTEAFFSRVNRKSYNEIIKEAERIIARAKEQEVKTAKDVIKKLENKKISSEKAAQHLNKLVVSNLTLSLDTTGSIPVRVAKFDLENNTGKIISKITFASKVQTPDKSMFFEAVFDFEIPMTLKNKEKRSMVFKNEAVFVELGYGDLAKGTEFSISPLRAYAENGGLLWDNNFTDEDAYVLDALKAEYGKNS